MPIPFVRMAPLPYEFACDRLKYDRSKGVKSTSGMGRGRLLSAIRWEIAAIDA